MEDHGRLGRETQTTINLDGYTTTNNTQTIHDNILLSPSNLVPDIMQKQQQQQGGQHGTSFPAGGPSRHRQEAEHGWACRAPGEGVWWRIHGHVGGGAMDGRIYATTSSRRHCQIHHPTKPTLPSVCSAWWCLYLIYNISMLCTNNENTGNTPHLWTRELIHMGVLITRTLTNSFIYVLFLLCVQTNQIFLLQIEHEEQQIPCNHAQNLMQNIYRQMLHTPFEGNDLFSFM